LFSVLINGTAFIQIQYFFVVLIVFRQSHYAISHTIRGEKEKLALSLSDLKLHDLRYILAQLFAEFFYRFIESMKGCTICPL